jgi:hypothetical protein
MRYYGVWTTKGFTPLRRFHVRLSLGSKKVLAALQQGDPGPLLAFHRSIFGDARMADDTDADGDGGDDGDDDKGDDADAKGDDGKGEKGKAGSPELAELKNENARRRQEAKAMKKTNDELAAKLKAIEDKDKSELDKATGGLTEAQAKAEKLAAQNQELVIQNAFLMDNKHTWANPKAALKLADLSDVEIDEDGNVTGLAEALAALAKSDPYLLKAEKDDDDEDDEKGPTGQPVGKKPRGNPSRDKLLDKYPALRR